MRKLWMMLFALIALILTACGPSPQEDFAQRVGQAMKSPTSDPSVVTPLVNMRRVALAAPDTADTPSITPDQLFDWAEATYPQFFPTKEKTLTWSVYQFRYYKDTDVYLAVENGTNVVALGTPTGNRITELGALTNYAYQVQSHLKTTGGGGSSSTISVTSPADPPWAITKVSNGGMISTLTYAPTTCASHNIIASGDLNNDGHDDIVIGPLVCPNNLGYVKLIVAFYNPATKTFRPDPAVQAKLPEMQWAQHAKIGDFNKDGYNDLFVTGTGSDYGQACGEAPVLMLGSKDGLVNNSHVFPKLGMYTHQTTVSDFNNDGKIDFVLLNNNWVPQPGDSNESACSYRPYPGTNKSFIVMSSGDTWRTSELSLYDKDGASVVTGKQSYNTSTSGDVNGDGNADLIVFLANFSYLDNIVQRAYTFFGDGKGNFEAKSYFVETPYGDNTVSVHSTLRQIDGQGPLELLVNYTRHPGKPSTPFQYSTYGIFNFDTATNSWTNKTSQYLTNKNNVTETNLTYCSIIQWVDINNDGRDDFICTNFSVIPTNDTEVISPRIWLKTANGRFEPAYHRGFNITGMFSSMVAAKLDGKYKVVGLGSERFNGAMLQIYIGE